jgi:hypothetical protein
VLTVKYDQSFRSIKIKIKIQIWNVTFLLNVKYLVLKYSHKRMYFKIYKRQSESIYEMWKNVMNNVFENQKYSSLFY